MRESHRVADLPNATAPMATLLQNEYLDARLFLEKGIMPKAGGYGDQDPFYVKCMIAILSVESELMRTARIATKNDQK